jgi:hypothetical protein
MSAKEKVFYFEKRKYHVISKFEDTKGNDEGLLYVVKFFGKYEQWWHYEIWSEFDFSSRKIEIPIL